MIPSISASSVRREQTSSYCTSPSKKQPSPTTHNGQTVATFPDREAIELAQPFIATCTNTIHTAPTVKMGLRKNLLLSGQEGLFCITGASG